MQNKDKEGWVKRFNQNHPQVSDLDSNRRKKGDTYADGYVNGHLAGVGLGLFEASKYAKAFIKKEKESYSQDLIEKIEGLKKNDILNSPVPFLETKEDIIAEKNWNEALSTIQEIIKQDNETNR